MQKACSQGRYLRDVRQKMMKKEKQMRQQNKTELCIMYLLYYIICVSTVTHIEIYILHIII